MCENHQVSPDGDLVTPWPEFLAANLHASQWCCSPAHPPFQAAKVGKGGDVLESWLARHLQQSHSHGLSPWKKKRKIPLEIRSRFVVSEISMLIGIISRAWLLPKSLSHPVTLAALARPRNGVSFGLCRAVPAPAAPKVCVGLCCGWHCSEAPAGGRMDE